MNLLSLIRRCGQNRIAQAVGISPAEMSRRITGDGRFTLDEVERLVEALRLQDTTDRVVLEREQYEAMLTVVGTLTTQAMRLKAVA